MEDTNSEFPHGESKGIIFNNYPYIIINNNNNNNKLKAESVDFITGFVSSVLKCHDSLLSLFREI